MELAVTVFPVPMFLSLNVAVPLAVRTSPTTRSSAYVTLAASLPSYVLLAAVIVMFSVRGVMFA